MITTEDVVAAWTNKERAKKVLNDACDSLKEQELKVDLAKRGLHDAQFEFNELIRKLAME